MLLKRTFLIIALLIFGIKTDSCTIFYIEKDGIILAGNNEDWKDNATKLFFYPASNGKKAWIKFGFGNGFPQGGMNENGLFWDGTSGPHLPMPVSEATKRKLQTPIMQTIIEECANVEDAKVILEKFYCEDQYKAQYLIGDSEGNSIIVEGDNFLEKNKKYQVLTNFYQSNPELGGYPCWRYDKACEILNEIDELTPTEIGKVLASTHQNGNYPTQYSNIYDLKNQLIYLFYFHKYEEFVLIDLKAELKKGRREFNIPALFSNVEIISPAMNELVSANQITFKWKGITDSLYEIVYSTNPDFSESNTEIVLHAKNSTNEIQFMMLPFLVFLFFMNIKRKKYFLVLLFFVLLGGINCTNEESIPNSDSSFSKTIDHLIPGQTYYWKIKAKANFQNDFKSETIVYKFTIE